MRGTAESAETPDVAAQTVIKAADAALPSNRLPGFEIGTKDSLPRTPTPTMKTESVESVDTDSASSLISSPHDPSTSARSPHHSSPSQEAKAKVIDTQVALKLLVSNGASGLIIGRSGSTISDLQAKSQSRIKLSQDGHFYPGTTDRVCLVQGSLSNASLAVEMVLSKLYDLQTIQQLTSTLNATNINESLPVEGERSLPSFIVRLLVPSTFCGKIIGRNGSNIKSLKDQSHVSYMQLSPKGNELTSERIMTIIGPNLSSCIKCVHIILEDMVQNAEISRYINMTTIYSTILSSPTSSSTGVYNVKYESFHRGISPVDSSTFMSPHPYDQDMFPSPTRTPRVGPSSPSFPQYQPSPPPTRTPHVGPSSPSYPQYQPSPSQSELVCPPFFVTDSPDRDKPSSVCGNLFVGDQLDQNFQLQPSLPRQPFSGLMPITVKIGVPSSKIGSILGRGGKTLTELQALSHTKIRISQQGEFIPGTQNRTVTITGNTEQSVEHAKYLVRQCLAVHGSRISHLSNI